MPTISKEDYLKAIYSFTLTRKELASTSKVAKKLSVSNAATSDMAKKLAEQGLIDYAKYKGMELTKDGERVALRIIRRHRLWELFLMKVLGLSWGEVHDEAEKFEHQTSDFLIDKIDEYLDYPEFDPHGHPIPDKKGVLPKLPELMPLKECKIGEKYKIIRVGDESNELMNYFTQLGISLNKEILFVDKLKFDNSVVIEIDGKRNSLSEKIAKNLYVTSVKGGR